MAWSAGQLRLWRALGDAWRVRIGEPNLPVHDAQFLLGGRLLAVVQRAPQEVRIVVAATHDGALQTSVRLPTVDLRFSSQRGYAIARVDQNLVFVDLRFGRIIRELRLPEGVTDFAIDASVQHIALFEGPGLLITPIDALPDAQAVAKPARRDSQGAGASPSTSREALGDQRPLASAAPIQTAPNAPPAATDTVSPVALTPHPADPKQTEQEPTEAVPASTTSSLTDADIRFEDPLTMYPAEPPNIDTTPTSNAFDQLTTPGDATLVRLVPVAALAPASPAEVERDINLLLRWAASRAGVAIARAWDSGRLSVSPPDLHVHQLEVMGLLGLQHGRATELLENARGRLYNAMQLRGVAALERGQRRTPFQRLRDNFGLSDAAEAVLAVLVAPQLRGELARLYQILNNDPGRATLDEHLLVKLFEEQWLDASERESTLSPSAIAARIGRELDADMPLRKFGLVRFGQGLRPFATLAVDPLVVRFVSGQPLDGEADPFVVERRAELPLEALQIDAALVRRAVRELSIATPQPLRLVVRGRAGLGRHAFVAGLAAQAGRQLGVIDTLAMPRGATLAAELRDALRRAWLRGLLPCVDGLEQTGVLEDPDHKLRVTSVLRDHPGPLVLRLGSEAQAPLDPGYLSYDLRPPNEIEREVAWQRAFSRWSLTLTEASELAARYRVGPAVIARVTADVAHAAHLSGDPAAQLAALDAGVRQHLENRLGQTATRVHRLASWSDLVLPQDIRDSLIELTARVRHRKQVYERWGFDRSITTARGITALFAGTPGTGKTMVAGVIARDLGMDLYRVDVSRITSKWIGETEKNLGALFDAAEDGQVMLLFDEADSLFAKRTEVKSSVDRYANMEVNYLLQRLDSFEGLAILTTNFGNAIDPAFKRRLTYRITFPFPDEEQREQLWQSMLPAAAPRAGTIDFASLARRFRMSGGYIRNAVLRAAFLAAEEGTGISHDHLERAVRMEFREMGKLGDSGALE